MHKVYTPEKNADRLQICYNDSTYHADFCTKQSVWHSTLRTLRQAQNPELTKSVRLWIDKNTSEIYMNEENQETPEIRIFLDKYEANIKNDYANFNNSSSPHQHRYPSWKTSFDNQYPVGVIKRANTPDELKETLSKGYVEETEDTNSDMPDVDAKTYHETYLSDSLTKRFHGDWGGGYNDKW